MKIKFDNIVKFFLISSVIGAAISYSKVYLFHISLAMLILSYLYLNNLKIKIKKLPTKLHYIFYFMFIWYFFSLIWSINKIYTLEYLFYIICGLSIVLTLVYYNDSLNKLREIYELLGSVFIFEIIISLLESFTNFRLPISPFSSYVVYFGREIKYDESLPDNIIYLLRHTPTGFQWNPNNLAVTFLIIFSFFLLHKKLKMRLFGVGSLILLIILTGSRGVFISLLTLLLVYSFLSIKRFIILIAMSILITLSLCTLNFSETLEDIGFLRLKEISGSFDAVKSYLFEYNDRNGSIGIRKQLIRNGLEALKDSYFMGVGGGGSKAVNEAKGGVVGRIASMHNFWIEMLVDGGIIFFVIFISWYLYVTWKLFYINIVSKNKELKYYSQATFLSMISFPIGAISASSVIYLFPMWLMYGFSISIINIWILEKWRKKNANINTW